MSKCDTRVSFIIVLRYFMLYFNVESQISIVDWFYDTGVIIANGMLHI